MGRARPARRALRQRDRPRRAVRRSELRRVARRRRGRTGAAALTCGDRRRKRGRQLLPRADARLLGRRRRRVGNAARLAKGNMAGRSRVSACGRRAGRVASPPWPAGTAPRRRRHHRRLARPRASGARGRCAGADDGGSRIAPASLGARRGRGRARQRRRHRRSCPRTRRAARPRLLGRPHRSWPDDVRVARCLATRGRALPHRLAAPRGPMPEPEPVSASSRASS